MPHSIVGDQVIQKNAIRLDEVIALPTSAGFSMMQVKEIMFITSDGNYSKVFYQDSKMAHVNRKLTELENFLPEEYFIRPHQQYLINKLYIAGYNKKDGELYLKSGKKIPVSVRKRKQFIDFFKTID